MEESTFEFIVSEIEYYQQVRHRQLYSLDNAHIDIVLEYSDLPNHHEIQRGCTIDIYPCYAIIFKVPCRYRSCELLKKHRHA